MSSNAPKRGKFLSQPQISSKESTDKLPTSSDKQPTPRGKVLGKSLKSTTSANSLTAGETNTRNGSSLSNRKTLIKEAKERASERRKEVAAKRDKVFRDLDEAENIVLSLLDGASDVARSLSEMTTAKANGNTNSFDDLAEKIGQNGRGYLAGVNKLHSLLSPHAPLVKAYRNPDEGDSIAGPPKAETMSTGDIIQKATSNMYAARVEKRLALERSTILNEMIRLEELESPLNSSADDKTEGAAAGSKRKIDSVE